MIRFALIALLSISAFADIPSTGYDVAPATGSAAGSSQTDFSHPIDLADMSATWWSTAEDVDPFRGRTVDDGDGTTEYQPDWIDYNHSAETGEVRVKFTNSTTAANNRVRIFPPVAANVIQGSGTSAYNANYISHYPMSDTGTPLVDHTSSGNDITATGTGLTFAAAGQLGTSFLNDGSNPNTSVALDLSSENTIIVEFWMYWDAFANDDDFAMEFTSDTNSSGNGFVVDPNVSAGTFGIANTGNVGFSSPKYTRPSGAAWHHYAAVFDKSKSTDEADLYLDGNLQTPTVRSQNNNNTDNFTNDVLYIFSRNNTSLFGSGRLQHFSVFTARSADAIDLEYRATNDQATFWGTWAWNAPAGGGTPYYYRARMFR